MHRETISQPFCNDVVFQIAYQKSAKDHKLQALFQTCETFHSGGKSEFDEHPIFSIKILAIVQKLEKWLKSPKKCRTLKLCLGNFKAKLASNDIKF